MPSKVTYSWRYRTTGQTGLQWVQVLTKGTWWNLSSTPWQNWALWLMTVCGIFLFDDTFAAEQRFQVSTRLKSTPMSRTTSPGWTHCTPDHSPPQCRNGDKTALVQNERDFAHEGERAGRRKCEGGEPHALSLSLTTYTYTFSHLYPNTLSMDRIQNTV